MKNKLLKPLSLLLCLALLLPILPVMAEESQCAHEWTEDGMCIYCEAWCGHEQFDEGFCTACGAQCGVIWEHEYDFDGYCLICGITCSHEWDGYGTCNICASVCYHNWWEEAVCIRCGYACECRVYMDANMYNNGVCYRCGTPCAHYYVDEVCMICNMACSHRWVNGYCLDCGKVCQHSYTDGICDLCAAEEAKIGYACLSGAFNDWAYELNMTPMSQRHLGVFVELESPKEEEFSLFYNGKHWGIPYMTGIDSLWTVDLVSGNDEKLPLYFPKQLSGRYLFMLDTVTMELTVHHYPEQMYLDLGIGVLLPMETDGMGKLFCTFTLGPGSYTVTHTDGGDYSYYWGTAFDFELTRTVDVTFTHQMFPYTGDDGVNYMSGYSTYIPPCEHIWVDGTCEICAKVCTHKWEQGTCTTCVLTCTHSYTDGLCTVCGMAQVPTLNLKYPTVSFEDEVKMNVYFAGTETEGVAQMGLAIYDGNPAQRITEISKQLVEGFTYDEGTGLYCVSTPGIAAKDLSQSVIFSVYALLKDGTYVYTDPISYSPQDYALSMVSNENTDPALKSATVSMLSYSAAAQTYFGIQEGDTSVELTEEMLALIEDYRDDMLQGVKKPETEKLGAFAATGSAFSKQYPTISFEGAFSINYYFAPSHAVEGDITLYVWDLATYEAVAELTAQNASQVLTMEPGEEYSAAVRDIAAKELDDTVYVAAVYSDGTATHCSGVLAYSIGAYCASQIANDSDAMKDLAAAVAVYGYYARTYFAA